MIAGGIPASFAVRAVRRQAERPRPCPRWCSFSSSSSSRGIVVDERRRRRTTTAGNGRIFLPTSVVARHRVPLTLADVHLRNEALPFLYLFRIALDRERLVSSLREVLRRYPILGAAVSDDFLYLECHPADVVPVSFDAVDVTLDEWRRLAEEEGRNGGGVVGTMQHAGWRGGGGMPTISALFDDLSPARWEEEEEEERDGDGRGTRGKRSTGGGGHVVVDVVSTVRITYFRGYGTAVGINISHLVGDASSCFRFCQVSSTYLPV